MGLRKLLDMEQEPSIDVPNPPMFITGCMRSGTSYLLAKMCEHPQLLQVGTELNRVWTDIGGASCIGDCDHKTAEDFDVRYASQMSAYITDYVNKAPKPHRTLMRVRRKLRGDGGRIWYDWDNLVPVNKSPHLINKTGYVNSIFPDSKWLCIVRSIYGNSASMKVFFNRRFSERNTRMYYPVNDIKACWHSRHGDDPDPQRDDLVFGLEEFWTIPRMWCRLNRILLDDIQNIPDDVVKVIRYEDLVRDQYNVMMDIFNFLDLTEDHRDACEQIAGNELKIVNTTSEGDPLEKWRSELTEEEIGIVEKETQTPEYKSIIRDLDLLTSAGKNKTTSS